MEMIGQAEIISAAWDLGEVWWAWARKMDQEEDIRFVRGDLAVVLGQDGQVTLEGPGFSVGVFYGPEDPVPNLEFDPDTAERIVTLLEICRQSIGG